METTRRTFLGGMGAVAAAIAVGVLKPLQALAAEAWNKVAFDAKTTAEAIQGFGGGTPVESADVVVKAPSIAENGAVVPVEVSSSIPNTVSIAVVVDENPSPLTAIFKFSNGAVPEAAMRLRMGKTSKVRAVAMTADGKSYTAASEVKVTIGGCGG